MEVDTDFALGLLGLFDPVTLVPIIVTGSIFIGRKNQGNILEKLKKQISDHAVQSLSDSVDQNAATIVDGIGEKFTSIMDLIVNSVSAELLDLEKQLDIVIREKQKDESDVVTRKNDLKKCEVKINDLIFTLMGN